MVHGVLESSPWLKDRVVEVYQGAFGLLPASDQVPPGLTLISGCFMGFHDKCPWSECGRYLAVHRPAADRVDPDRSEVGIGLLDLHASGLHRPIARSRLWNWQQGAELQWLAGTGFVVFNDERAGHPGSVLVDTNGGTVHRWDLPVAALDRLGRNALSLDFGELASGAPGYGYPRSMGRGSYGGKLTLMHLADSSVQVLFDVGGVSSSPPNIDPVGRPFLSHPSFSPDGRTVAFYCRSRDRRGYLRTSVYVVALDGGRVTRLPLDDCSHYAWIDDRRILAYARPVSGRWQYLIISPGDARVESANWIGHSDGHPQAAPDGRRVVTDSYPDRKRVQRLFVADLQTREVSQLAALRIPWRFRGVYRCDFHPRWSRDGSRVAIDTAHTGVRSVGILPVESSCR